MAATTMTTMMMQQRPQQQQRQQQQSKFISSQLSYSSTRLSSTKWQSSSKSFRVSSKLASPPSRRSSPNNMRHLLESTITIWPPQESQGLQQHSNPQQQKQQQQQEAEAADNDDEEQQPTSDSKNSKRSNKSSIKKNSKSSSNNNNKNSKSSSWDDVALWNENKERDEAAAARAWRKWNPLQKAAAIALDALEQKVLPLMEAVLPASSNPAVQLSGNFAPVPEHAPEDNLPVGGRLPACLAGLYVRNGANPRFRPAAGHHLFDGDGMLHAVRIGSDGQSASYCARFTRTARLREEERLGRPIFPKPIGELHGHGGAARLLLFAARSAAGIVDGAAGMGPANAGVVFFNGRLLAMSEDDQPYRIRVHENSGELRTEGRYDFGGQLGCTSMIAHPKKDTRTGELFALSYDVVRKPYLRCLSFAPDGSKKGDVEISLRTPTMMHDFAITQRFVVIPDQQVVFQLGRMMSGKSPVVFDAQKMPRFGLLPKDATDESQLRWIDVPDCFCFHVWNAWEETDPATGHESVVVLGSCMTPPDAVFNSEHESEMSSLLSLIRLDLVTGTSSRTAVAGLNLEAGTVNPNMLGRRSRYLYLAIADPWPLISGVAKIDLSLQQQGGTQSDCVLGKRIHGHRCYGGEPFFVPRTSDPDAAEDDGYVLTFVHNEVTGTSELVVLDASTDNLELVATVKLPCRVPYGFHGTFLSEADLASQKDD